jgi:PKD repeat protein
MLSDIGQPLAGQPLTLSASGFDPAPDGADLSYAWSFGDGTTASGTSISHVYRAPGTYTLTLTVSSSHGRRVISKVLSIEIGARTYSNPYSPLRGDDTPNPAVSIPTPDNSLPAQSPLAAPFAQAATSATPPVSTVSPTVAPIANPHSSALVQPSSTSAIRLLVIGLAAVALGLCLVGTWLLLLLRKRGRS